MIDCHYDLLTHILMKKENREYIKKYCDEVYNKENITGGIFNLFYMSKEEMKEEIGIKEDQIDLIKDLKEVKKYIKENKIIPKEIQYIFGIEGLDYLKKIEDIDILYSLGLRSTNPVWSNKNKFGAGVRANNSDGLTELGRKLITKLVNKKIAIDLSHANEKTFWDIVYLCEKMKETGKDPIVFASHSNAKAICNVSRNLTDSQILKIKELGGIIGIVSIKKFCVDTEDICNPNIDYEQKYIDNINYIKRLLGGVENIAVATDDMRYYYIEPEYYQHLNIYFHNNVKKSIENALVKNGYTKAEIEKILEKNLKEKILNRL